MNAGESFSNLSYYFRIGISTISKIIPETCRAICSFLENEIALPSTTEEWLNITDSFEKHCNIPNCLEEIDGKHIIINGEHKPGSYYNYKGFNSITCCISRSINRYSEYAKARRENICDFVNNN